MRILPLSLACLSILTPVALCADPADWPMLEPGMTRKTVEPMIEKRQPPAPAADDADGGDVALPTGAMALYETPKQELEGYRLNERDVLVVPYVRDKQTLDESEGHGKERHEQQKVAGKPWILHDFVTPVSDPAADAFVHLAWPAPHKAGDQDKLHAHIFEGNLFGNGDVAVVAFSNPAGNALVAAAFYRLKNTNWELRSFFDAAPNLPSVSKDGRFLEFMELNGDAVPEIAVHKENGRRGNAYAIYKYDARGDRLQLAIADIVDPGWDGSRVGSFIHYGAGHSSELIYAWEGASLAIRSRAEQGGSAIQFPLLDPSLPDGASIAIQYAERDPKSGSLLRRFAGIGNVSWIEGALDAASGKLWTICNIGQMRRRISVQIDADKMQRIAPGFSAYDLGNAIFPWPEKFMKNAKAKLASSEKSVRIADFAAIEIADDWPLVLSEEATMLADDDRIEIPPLRAEAKKRPDPFAEQSQSSVWRGAFTVGPKTEHSRQSDLVTLYISGPDQLADSASLSLKEARLEGSTLNLVCALSSNTATGAAAKLVRPAVALNLGALKPALYTAHITITQAADAGGAPANPVEPIECSFRIE